MWYLIVSIPDLCNLTYFALTNLRSRGEVLIYLSVVAVGRYVVCDCGISLSYSLTFLVSCMTKNMLNSVIAYNNIYRVVRTIHTVIKELYGQTAWCNK